MENEVIKIAPDLSDIKVEGNILECEFNNIYFKWVLAFDPRTTRFEEVLTLKAYLQAAIGFYSKTHQVREYLQKYVSIPNILFTNQGK